MELSTDGNSYCICGLRPRVRETSEIGCQWGELGLYMALKGF